MLCVVTQRLLLPSWQCSRSSVCCSCDCQFCPKDAKPPFCMKFQAVDKFNLLSMIATPLIISESSAKVCCLIYPVSLLSWENANAYCHYLILWIRHTPRVIPTCHANIQSLVKMIKITVYGFFFFLQVLLEFKTACRARALHVNDIIWHPAWGESTRLWPRCRVGCSVDTLVWARQHMQSK